MDNLDFVLLESITKMYFNHPVPYYLSIVAACFSPMVAARISAGGKGWKIFKDPKTWFTGFQISLAAFVATIAHLGLLISRMPFHNHGTVESNPIFLTWIRLPFVHFSANGPFGYENYIDGLFILTICLALLIFSSFKLARFSSITTSAYTKKHYLESIRALFMTLLILSFALTVGFNIKNTDFAKLYQNTTVKEIP